jgi:hypothetical protein
MALHSTNFLALKKTVKLAISASPDAQLHPLADLVNEALTEFGALHDWAWRQKTLSLDTVAAQEYIALPTDLAHLDILQVVGSVSGLAIPVTLEEIIARRSQQGIDASNLYFYAVTWTTQAADNVTPIPRLELFPTPSASTSGAFVGRYTRTIARLEDDADVPDVPAQFHTLLDLYCRCHALEKVGDQKGLKFANQVFADKLERLKQESGEIQRNLGSMRCLGSGRARVVNVAPVINYP